MNWLFHWIWGYVVFSFPKEKKTDVLNHFLEKGIGILALREEGEVSVLILRRGDAASLPKELELTLLREEGLLYRLRCFWRRPGLMAGCLAALLIFCLSSAVVWRIEVRGNSEKSATEIERTLSEAGLSVGAFIPSIDTAAVRARFLEADPGISFAGIYRRGTTVTVEVREAMLTPGGEEDEGLYNLVAAEDAVIESITPVHGRAGVVPGMTVKKGDLLISGIYETAGGLVGITAEGEVKGRVIRTVTVLQPMREVNRVYGEEKRASLILDFFGKQIKLFKSYGKSGEEYDIIRRKEQLILFDRIRLPISFVSEYVLPYAEEEAVLSEEEAVAAAFSRMKGELCAALSDAEVLREAFWGEFTAEGYRLVCEVECVVDIAMPLAYEVEHLGG